MKYYVSGRYRHETEYFNEVAEGSSKAEVTKRYNDCGIELSSIYTEEERNEKLMKELELLGY